MPWSEAQRTAIYLAVKRKKGEKAAKALMHRHGYGGKRRTKEDIARALASKR